MLVRVSVILAVITEELSPPVSSDISPAMLADEVVAADADEVVLAEVVAADADEVVLVEAVSADVDEVVLVDAEVVVMGKVARAVLNTILPVAVPSVCTSSACMTVETVKVDSRNMELAPLAEE